MKALGFTLGEKTSLQLSSNLPRERIEVEEEASRQENRQVVLHGGEEAAGTSDSHLQH